MHRTRLIVAGLFIAAAACSSNNTTGGTTASDNLITSDVATTAADGMSEDVDVMVGMDGLSGNSANLNGTFLVGPGDWRPHLTGCTFAGGSFTCPDTTQNGLVISRVITLTDANGQTESAYDPLLTASIHVVADISGDVTHGHWSAHIVRHHDFIITGLAGSETTRTVNGTGNETVTRVRDTEHPRGYDVTCSSVITNVVLPVRTADGGSTWPISGTITRTCTVHVTAGPDAGKTTTRTITITFNGTSTPTATSDGQTFTIDLSAHTATHR